MKIQKGGFIMSVKPDTSMTIRMNKEVKQQAQQIFAELGMDMTTAVNVFLRQAIRTQGFPFDITLKTPNSMTMAAIKGSYDKKDMQGPFDSIGLLMEDLDA
jgi:DNA-damage-inducible protein J